jgi:hypothetical protein
MTTPEPIKSPETAINTPSVTGGCCGPSPCSRGFIHDLQGLNSIAPRLGPPFPKGTTRVWRGPEDRGWHYESDAGHKQANAVLEAQETPMKPWHIGSANVVITHAAGDVENQAGRGSALGE